MQTAYTLVSEGQRQQISESSGTLLHAPLATIKSRTHNAQNTGLFKMIVWVLTTCHTQ
jgi:hypothetical protein